MSLQELKLLLIKKIANSEDPKQLLSLLQLLEKTPLTSVVETTDNEKTIVTLLQKTPQFNTNNAVQQEEIDELQQSINELFES